MKRKILLNPEGNWYKANLHCHCTVSDGAWTAEKDKEEYQKQGYSVIAFTDHMDYQRHTELDDETFLTIGAFGSAEGSQGWRKGQCTGRVHHAESRGRKVHAAVHQPVRTTEVERGTGLQGSSHARTGLYH